MADGQQGGSTAVSEQSATQDILADSRFSGSVSIDQPETRPDDGQPGKPQDERQRNERGQFTEKAKEDNREDKAVKLPESIKLPKPRDEKDINGRFHDLSRSHEELRRELRQAREELQRIQGGKSNDARLATTQPNQPESRMRPEDFQTYDEYVKAMINDSIEQKKSSVEEAMRSQALEEYKKTKREEFEGHAKDVLAAVPNFWEVISDHRLPMTEAMGNAVMELGKMGPITALHLASNPQEAFAISNLSPLSATIAIGRIAERLQRELEQPNQASAESPDNHLPQVKPRAVPDVRGGTPAQSLDDQPSEKDSTEEWLRKETMRLRKANPTAKFWSRF